MYESSYIKTLKVCVDTRHQLLNSTIDSNRFDIITKYGMITLHFKINMLTKSKQFHGFLPSSYDVMAQAVV